LVIDILKRRKNILLKKIYEQFAIAFYKEVLLYAKNLRQDVIV